jgi:fibronectin type 3 domain-containing protein
MKHLIATILLSGLIVLFSGCEGKNFGLGKMSLPKLSVPSLDLSNLRLDRSLPTVSGLKIKSSISEVALEWQPIRKAHIAGYRILRNNDEGGYSLIATIPDRYASHYTDKNTRQYKYNTYLVSVYTDDGRVSRAAKIRIGKLPKPLTPVAYVAAVSGLPNRIKILWRIDPDERVVGYVIQRYDPIAKVWQNLAYVDKRLSVEYIDTTVRPGVEYRYRVIAKGEDGVHSKASKEVVGKSKPLPPVVSGLMATTNLAKRVDLIWKASPIPDLHHYNVYASSFEDGVYRLIAKTKATSYSDKFDNDGEIRFYKVTVVDNDGLESSKAVKPVKGMTLGRLAAPLITSAKVIDNKVELKWENRDSRTVAYNIYKSFWNGWRMKKIKIKGFKGTTFLDPKIKPNTTYTYYVRAVDQYGIESKDSRAIKVEVEGITKKRSFWTF